VSDYSVVDPDTVKSEPRTSGRRIKTTNKNVTLPCVWFVIPYKKFLAFQFGH
jgi:hypothetical protein